MAFKKAIKEQAKLRLGLCGLAGAGKTYTALLIAHEMGKLMRANGHGKGRIALIDSERGSASLYADKFDFDVTELDMFSPLAYVEKIREAEAAGYDFIIADSISHAWAGKGGALDQKDQAAERGGNSWTAWRDVTPKHNAFVDAMLTVRAHFIATMRQKMEHVQEVENGKTKIKKVGLAAIQREGMEYEFTLVGDIDHSHTLKISKTRCDGVMDIGDQFERPGELFAAKIYGWLMNGQPPRPREVPPSPVPANDALGAMIDTGRAVLDDMDRKDAARAEQPGPVADALDEVFEKYLQGMREAKTQRDLDAAATIPAKPEPGTPKHKIAGEVYVACRNELKRQAKEAKAGAA